MLLVVFAVLAVAVGRRISAWLFGAEHHERPLERAASSGLLGVGVAVAATWALAIPKLLTRASLLAVMGVALVVVAWRVRIRLPRARRVSWLVVAALAPVALFLAFVLLRGATMFVANNDALSYHFPRAVLVAREHGYAVFDGTDGRVGSFPANYELLVADALLLDGTDVYASWLGAGAYALFLVFVAAMAERWWGAGLHVVAAVLVAGAMPVALLHAGAHKNDLLTCALVLGAAHFAARFVAAGGRGPLVLAVVALALTLGTKTSGLFLAAAIAPWLLVAAWRRRSRRPTLRASGAFIVFLLAAFALLGPASYAYNLVATGSPFGALDHVQSGYSDFSNLWRFPIIALTAPFSVDGADVWVPGASHRWYDDPRDLYFSTYGAVCSVCFVAMPFAALVLARRGSREVVVERLVGSTIAGVTSLLVLPLTFRPLGLFLGSTRYTMFAAAVAVLWTVPPLVRWLAALVPRGRSYAALALGGSSLLFVLPAIDAAVNDKYLPLDALLSTLAGATDRRHVPIQDDRAASVVDRLAGPEDVIAIDGAFDTWIYPAYGRDLRRDLRLLHADDTAGPVEIPGDARWVIVDRSWSYRFGHPDFVDFGRWHELLGAGTPAPEDLKVARQLQHDPRFRLVFAAADNQWVFRRMDGDSIHPSSRYHFAASSVPCFHWISGFHPRSLRVSSELHTQCCCRSSFSLSRVSMTA